MENAEWKRTKEVYDNKELNGGMIRDNQGRLYLGRYYSYQFATDIKHLMISLSRYKFVTKLISYKKDLEVIEIGCQEGIGGAILKQETDLRKYVGVDFDSEAIEWCHNTYSKDLEFINEDFFDLNYSDNLFDVAFCLDVIEHIDKTKESLFVKKMSSLLKSDGIAIVGTPNITMSPYASEASKRGHINLFNHKRLYNLVSGFFRNVLILSMNDEVIHTGFEPMCCYIFAIGIGPKE